MTLVIPQITVPILAILALNKVIFEKVDKAKLWNALKWSAGITGGLSLLFLIIPSLAGNFSSASDMRLVDAYSSGNPQVRQFFINNLIPAIEADREAMLRTDAFRSLVFVLLSGGLIYLYKIKNMKMNVNLVLVLFAVLFIADMWPVDKRFLNDANFETKSQAKKPYTATAADQAILQSKGLNERVLNLTVSPFQDANTPYFHQSLGGYHGAKMRRYQDLINTRLMDEMQALFVPLQKQDFTALDSTLAKLNIINMLNTRFFIINPNGAPLTNRYAMGNAWFVDALEFVENADEELQEVTEINLKLLAVSDKKFADQVENTSFESSLNDQIILTDYLPNKLTYKSTTSADRFAVFSEIYYEKGWEATIDGEEATHIRVDYLLRGMEIPAGEHTVVFEFKPKSYYAGEKVSYAGSIILLLLLAGAIFLEFRKGKKAE